MGIGGVGAKLTEADDIARISEIEYLTAPVRHHPVDADVAGLDPIDVRSGIAFAIDVLAGVDDPRHSGDEVIGKEFRALGGGRRAEHHRSDGFYGGRECGRQHDGFLCPERNSRSATSMSATFQARAAGV